MSQLLIFILSMGKKGTFITYFVNELMVDIECFKTQIVHASIHAICQDIHCMISQSKH